jgi:hypothetical protein
MNNLYWYFLFVLFLSSCSVTDNSDIYLHENNYAKIESIEGEFEKTPDTILYVSKISSFQTKISISE